MSLLKNRHLLTLALAHLTADTYSNMLPILWPVFVTAFSLDYAMVGFASACYTLAGSLSQPLFGYLGDKHGSRWLGAVGVGWVAVCISCTALAPGYPWLVAFCLLAGLGSAAYHPQGALNTTLISGRRAGLGIAIFMVGGNLGYALGPVAAAAALGSSLGLRGVPLLALPGLLLALLLFRLLGAVDRERAAIMVRRAGTTAAAGARRAPLRVIFLVILAIVLRGWSEMGLITYLPLLYRERQLDFALVSQLLFVMLVVEAAAGLLGGALSDRFDRRLVLAAAYPVIGLAVLGFLFLPGLPPMAALALAGLGIGATVPVTTVMGQELLPRNLGVGSGLVLGLSFVASGLGVFLTGVMADHLGLETAFVGLGLLPFAGVLVAFFLPPGRQAPRVAVRESAA
ncbi:MAG: MFS transporter [Chloroflexi bacterium]|nr:MFS transporter [Chloroflexota bacterium]